MSAIIQPSGGIVIQAADKLLTAEAGGSAAIIPFDNTIPQNTEGDEYTTLAFTPTRDDSIIEIWTQAHLFHGTPGSTIVTALFKDSGANALATFGGFSALNSGNYFASGYYTEVSGDLTTRTYKLRYGGSATGVHVNKHAATSHYGLTLQSGLIIRERAPVTAFAPGGAGGGGALQVIESKSITSPVTAVDFTSGIDGTYEWYKFKGIGIINDTAGKDINARVSQDGGSTFKAGASDYNFAEVHQRGSSHLNSGTTADALVITAGNSTGIDAGETYHFEMDFYHPSNTNLHKMFGGRSETRHSDGAAHWTRFASNFILNTAAIDAMRFRLDDVANISNGRITLYGVAHG